MLLSAEWSEKVAAIAAGIGAAYYLDQRLLLHHDLAAYGLLLGAVVKTQWMVYRNILIPDIWEQLVDRLPSKILVRFEGQKLSAIEIDTYANKIANWAISIGLKQGDNVGLFMQNRPEFIATWIGLSKIGVVCALINTHIAQDGLLHCIKISHAKVVIFGTELSTKIAQIASNLTHIRLFSSLDGTYIELTYIYLLSTNVLMVLQYIKHKNQR